MTEKPSPRDKTVLKSSTKALEKEIHQLEAKDEMDPLMSNRSRIPSSHRGSHSPRGSSHRDSYSPRARLRPRSVSSDHVPEAKDCKGRMRNFFESKTYDYIMCTIILLNCLSIVYQIDDPDLLIPAEWLIVNLIFFFIYAAEIALKIMAFGPWEYIQVGWHQFDVLVTVLAAIQIAAYYSIIDEKLAKEYDKYVSGDMIQILRLFRLIRLARIFEDLAVLIQAFIASVKALLWIGLMAILWFYLCACAATVFIGRKEWLPTDANPTEPDDIREVREAFATIPLSMFALFEVMTLEGWCDYVRPLLYARPHIVACFLFFIFVSVFFLLNLLTAVVVDRTLTAQKQAKGDAEEDAQAMQREHIDVLYEVLLQLNDGEPEIKRDTFMDCLRNPTVTEKLVALGWNRDFMISIFELIDHDNDGDAELMRMRKLWIASNSPLDTSNFVRFQINLAHRMDYGDKVALTVLDAIESISGKKLNYDENFFVKPTFVSKSQA